MEKKKLSFIIWFRWIWWLITLLTIGLDLYGLYLASISIGQVCDGPACKSYQLTSAHAQQLAAAGISLSFYTLLACTVLALSNLCWVGMGLILYRLKSLDRVVLLISFGLIAFGSSAFGTLDYVSESSFLPLATLVDWMGAIGQVAFIFFFIFPDGRFTPPWTRWLALLWTLSWLPRLFTPHYSPANLFPPLFLAFVGSVVVAQLLRYRRIPSPVQRQQVKWVVFSIVVAFVYFLFYLVLGFVLPGLQENGLLDLLLNLLIMLTMGLIPVSVGIALLRYRLWDIDVIIRRTLLYGALTVLLGAAYLTCVIVLQQILRALTGQESPLAVVASTLAIAALFSSVRRRVQAVLDRRFYRARYDASHALDTFSAAVRDEVVLEQITGELTTIINQTLKPESVTLWLRSSHNR